MKISYGKWTRGLLPVEVDGAEVGFVTEEEDGWAFWRAVDWHPRYFEMASTAKTRDAAVRQGLEGAVLEHD